MHWRCISESLEDLSKLTLLLIGTTIYDVDNATHTYTALGTYNITCVAINAIGNTTILYVVVVQIPVSPHFVLNSSAPVMFTISNNTGKQTLITRSQLLSETEFFYLALFDARQVFHNIVACSP